MNRLRDRGRELRDRARELAGWFKEERPDDHILLRCLRGFVSIDFRDRILVIAGQMFVALIPLVIVTASLVTAEGADELAEEFVIRMGLDQETAEEIGSLVHQPPGVTSSISVVGFLIVVFSVTSLGRVVRRTFEYRWELPPATGFRASRDSLLGVFVLVLMGLSIQTIVGLVAPDTDRFSAALVLTVGVQLVASVACWWVAMWLFLNRRVTKGRLWPGAIYAAIAQIAAGWLAQIYLPRLIVADVMRYGALGFSFALVSWLLVLGTVIASSAVVGAEIDREIGRRRAGRSSGK